jgi:kynurenine formamidase
VEDVRGYLTELSNWGRWGEGEEGLAGTLNLITPERRAAAAALAHDGVTVSLGIPLKFAEGQEGRDEQGHLVVGSSPYPVHFALERERMEQAAPGRRVSTFDGFLIQPHGQLITHLDAPCHTYVDGTFFNGVPAEGAFTEDSALVGSVDMVADGIVGRGVLLDVPGSQGRDWLEDDEAVMPEDLDRAASWAEVEVRPGDCVYVRTGYRGRALYQLRTGADYRRPGVQAACLPWLREHDVALLATDVPTDCFPHEYGEVGFPIHTVGMWAIGLWLVDNCLLEAVAAHARAVGRHEFLSVIAPLVIPGGTGSPVNPLAMF